MKNYYKSFIKSIKMLFNIKNLGNYCLYYLMNLIATSTLFLKPFFNIADLKIVKNNNIKMSYLFLDKEYSYSKNLVALIFKYLIILSLILLCFIALILINQFGIFSFYENRTIVNIAFLVVFVILIYIFSLKFRPLNFYLFNFKQLELKDIYENSLKTANKKILNQILGDFLSLILIGIVVGIGFLIYYCLVLRTVDGVCDVGMFIFIIYVLISIIYFLPLINLTYQNYHYQIYLNDYILDKEIPNLTISDVVYFNDRKESLKDVNTNNLNN